MTRIAILGANGQVGAELCAILGRQSGVTVVPVCRNRLGSAYLRSMGIACRHGQSADAADAARLFGDCDAVVNLALVSSVSDPAGARELTRRIAANVARQLGPRGVHLFFSTMSVYGDQEMGERYGVPGPYGADKLWAERVALREGAAAGCTTTVFRLGHVCGELQGITREIRATIRQGVVRLPDPGRASNVTYVGAIAEAILVAARRGMPAGTYDLMNEPQWSWREVFEFEARQLGLPVVFETVADRPPVHLLGLIRGAVAVAAGHAFAADLVRKLLGRLVAKLPQSMYRRLRGRYAMASAARDIAALGGRTASISAAYRKPIAARAPPGVRTTKEVLCDPGFAFRAGADRQPFPRDLAGAGG